MHGIEPTRRPTGPIGPGGRSLGVAVVDPVPIFRDGLAALVVVLEDRRAAKRAALQRKARLARLGEVDPLAPGRLHVDR